MPYPYRFDLHLLPVVFELGGKYLKRVLKLLFGGKKITYPLWMGDSSV